MASPKNFILQEFQIQSSDQKSEERRKKKAVKGPGKGPSGSKSILTDILILITGARWRVLP
jgi:hypothetical protein